MKTKQFLLILLACLCFPFAQLWSNPVHDLLERIDPGAFQEIHHTSKERDHPIFLNSTRKVTR